jgi:hypothetical protein
VTAPIDMLLAFVLGGAISLACRVQLRLNPRPWYATRYFAAMIGFFSLVFLPAAAYRYFFHPDWSVMYLLDTSSTPGLFGLIGLLLLGASAIGAFVLGNYCARAHREWLLLTTLALAVAGIATIAAIGVERIKLVGSFAQWQGSFGLRPLAATDLFLAVVVMGACAALAWLHILVLFAREGAAVRNASR